MSEVKACRKPSGTSYLDPIYLDRKVYVGIDRARVHDITSFCVMFPMDDGGVDCFYINILPKATVDSVSDYLRSKYLKAIETGDLEMVYTPTVKNDDIKKVITKLNDELRPEAFHYDPWHMREVCEDMEELGIPMVAVSNGTGNMSEPAKSLEGLIKESLFRYDSVLFEYACECAMMSMTRKNNMEVWRENDKVDKIDPLISTIITLSGATLIRVEQNVYNDRGMLLV
jgi:phage terminase large subunit-like protein